MTRFRNILLAAIAFAGLSGCIYDHYPEGDEPVVGNTDDKAPVTLLLRVGTAAPTRATAPDSELMHSLRIVLVDANTDVVEYNVLIDDESNGNIFGSGIGELDYSRFRVLQTQPGPKKIFFIANEHCTKAVNGNPAVTLTQVLDSRLSGQTGFQQVVESAYFTPDFGSGIVLSSCYEFEIGEGDVDPQTRRVEKEFWLVHAATKFEFVFDNHRHNAITVDQLTVSSAAADMYLMANLADSEKTKRINGNNFYWIDWLRQVCDDTEANPDLPENPDVNEQYGWISDYYLPSDDHAEADIKSLVGRSGDYWRIEPGASLALPAVYLPESKYTPDGGEQKYAFSVTLTDTGAAEMPQKVFPDNELVNLKALFRNTNVRVTVLVDSVEEETVIDLQIGVCPWNYESVDIPTFD